VSLPGSGLHGWQAAGAIRGCGQTRSGLGLLEELAANAP